MKVGNNTPVLVSISTGKWRIIRSHYYYNYDMAIYAAEDFTHSNSYSSHTDIINYACSSLYLKGQDNQKLIFTGDTLDTTASEIATLLDQSRFFVLRAHGSPNSFLLNARDGNGANIGSAVYFNLSLLNSNSSNLNDLSNLYCAMFLSCHSAEGEYDDEDSDNFVNAVMDRGAQSAIGFDGTANCYDIEKFSLAFFTQYCNMVGSISARALESYQEAVFFGDIIYTNEFAPYFTNEYYSLTEPS